jgi:uncharacterized protein YjbI with pentapeptide repeats
VGEDINPILANLTTADLRKAALQEADLAECTLGQVTLTKATLQDANLGSAVLQNANLTHAVLTDTNLTNAYLSEARGRTMEQLTAARSLEGTTMPDGQTLKSDKTPHGPTFEEWLKDKAGRGENRENRGSS